jgi:hypothetical protein
MCIHIVPPSLPERPDESIDGLERDLAVFLAAFLRWHLRGQTLNASRRFLRHEAERYRELHRLREDGL